MSNSRISPQNTRQNPEYRQTAIDVFIGGPADGKRISVENNLQYVEFAVPDKDEKPFNLFDLTHDIPRLTFHKVRYQRERLRSNSGETISDITFWVAHGVTIEQALVKLCLGYQPQLKEEPQPA